MSHFAQRAWKELLKNYDVYAVVLTAPVLSMLGIIGTASVPLVLSGTLAILAIIAFGILKNRQTDETIQKTLEQVASTQHGASALEFFKEWDEALFEQRLQTAKELSILAHANHDFISRNEERFREFIREGGRIRYILLDPNGNAMRLFAARSGGAERSLANVCLQIMSNLAKDAPPGSVEIKLIDHLLSAVITMLDPQTQRGIIFASLCGFNQFFLSRPSFVLHKHRDGKFFAFYQTYFDNLWNWEGCSSFNPVTKASASRPNEQARFPL